MYVVRVRDRGRDLAFHKTDEIEEAREIARVYELLGYSAEKILVEQLQPDTAKAA